MDVLAQPEKSASTSQSKNRTSISRITIVSLGIALVAFLVTEFLHYLLVPDIGRLRERLLAEVLSAMVVGLLAGGLLYVADQRRQFALLRMQVIAEMNHHTRNALAAISLTTDSLQNQQAIRVIFDSVEHIDWALREILPRSTPLRDEDRKRLWFFHATRARIRPGPKGNNPPNSGETSSVRKRVLVSSPLGGSNSIGQITSRIKSDPTNQRRA